MRKTDHFNIKEIDSNFINLEIDSVFGYGDSDEMTIKIKAKALPLTIAGKTNLGRTFEIDELEKVELVITGYVEQCEFIEQMLEGLNYIKKQIGE